jgi:hypothetical protein
MEFDFGRYKSEVSKDIAQQLQKMACQPILFIGSGLTIRYLDGPSWDELLRHLATECAEVEKEYAYYKQSHSSPLDIGQTFSELYKEWAWSSGRDQFPEELFEEDYPPDIYLKYKVAEYFEDLTPDSISGIGPEEHRSELESLQKIRPHSIVTTNYDPLIELLFPDYEPIVGQSILRSSHASFGELFKIHGCSSEPGSIVITRDDYDEFVEKKKYLSAKLLTYFAEHPLLFIGYSATDPNIRAILSDIDEILSAGGDLVSNIYLMQWDPNAESGDSPQKEKLIPVGDNRSVRVKSITTSSFEWVFDAFGTEGAIDKVNPKLLRALMARTYKLVRHDIPKKTIEVDYELLERAIQEEAGLAKIYGITTLNDPSAINAHFPYSLTQVAEELGYDHWHPANELIKQVEEETGVNIKESDNRYHAAIKVGKVSKTHKYSTAAVDLLQKVDNEEDYELQLNP